MLQNLRMNYRYSLQNLTVEQTLVKPCLLKAGDIVLESESKQNFSQIPLSVNTVKRHIDGIAEDIKTQIVEAVKESIFLEYSWTRVLMVSNVVFVLETIKGELLFSTELTTISKAIDTMTAISESFDKHQL